jgi:hypothetical protein
MRTEIFIFIGKTVKSKPVKEEVNGTMILPPLVFPGLGVKKPTVTDILSYSTTVFITAVKSFIVKTFLFNFVFQTNEPLLPNRLKYDGRDWY